MTAPRITRASRSRFFIGIVALLLMIGFVAIFHSSQQQLDESRQMRLRCEQQQEVLNARMQAIVEHKFRLEKSLETERREHLEVKRILEKKAKEQKELHNKASQESNARLESAQQHYKLLQSEHLDLKESCERTKAIQSAQMNELDRKVNVLEAQLKVLKQQKETEVLHWKLKYETAETAKKRLQNVLDQDSLKDNCHQKVLSLQSMLAEYKANCKYNPASSDRLDDHTPSTRNEVVKSAIEKNFKAQVPVSDGIYKIPIKLFNKTKEMHENVTIKAVEGSNINKLDSIHQKGSIINSVENFQIAQNPIISGGDHNVENKGDTLQQPPPLRAPQKPSTAATNSKTPEGDHNPPLLMASIASPISEKSKRSSTAANDRNKELYKSLGVAPVPENFDALIKNEEHNQSGNNNNRYANVVDELSGKKDEGEQDNAAHEVKDNDFNLGDEKNEGKDHLQEVLDNMNNAAEDDTNGFFDTKLAGRSNKKGNGEDDDVELVGGNKHEKPEGLLEGDDKLINEVVADQGKVAFPDGLHMEEAAEEDDDDYSNPAARQQEGPAVRN